MFMKSILAATAVAATLAGAAPAAQAKHHHLNLDVNVGVPVCGSGYYDPACDYPPPPPPPRPRHVYVPDYSYDSGYGGDYGFGDNGYDGRYDGGYDRLSCGEGRMIVRQSGWRGVRPFDCDGQNYKYTGFRRGDNWVIVLDSRTGTIIRRYRN